MGSPHLRLKMVATSLSSLRFDFSDLAIMDDEGYVKIVGRIKDMICRGGENIYPTEIEGLLFTNPKVEDAHVIGVPDFRLGEAVCAWIRLRHGVTCTAEEIKEFCKGKVRVCTERHDFLLAQISPC